MSHETCPSHTAPVFNLATRRKVHRWACKEIRKLKADAIVVIGQSGIMLGTLVSTTLNLPLVIVRKNGEPAVAGSTGRKCNYIGEPAHHGFKRWVFLDDLIASGSTLGWTIYRTKIEEVTASLWPVACVLYKSRQDVAEMSRRQVVAHGDPDMCSAEGVTEYANVLFPDTDVWEDYQIPVIGHCF